MTKILITGGTGFIGSNIAREFIELGHQVILFDAFIQYIPTLKLDYNEIIKKRLKDIEDKCVIVRGNAANRGEIQRAIMEHKPEIIIHLTALPISTLSNIYVEEAVEACIISTMNILEVIKNVDFVKRFIYTSSSMVYGDFEKAAVDEEHPTNPKDVYGGVKLAGEHFVKAFCKRFNIDYCIIRPSAVYGPTDINKRIVQICVENAIKGEEITLNGADVNKLDFTYVKDTAHGFVLAALSPNAKNQTFNITNGQARSLRELSELLKKYFPDLKIKEGEVDKHIPLRGTLDISKAKKLLGYEPKYNLEKGLEEYVEFMKRNFGK